MNVILKLSSLELLWLFFQEEIYKPEELNFLLLKE